MSVNVEVSDEQLRRAQNILGHIPNAVPKAISRAINRAITAANTEATKRIQGQYTIKNKRVISKAKSITQRASASNLSAIIKAQGKPISLGAFLTNPKKVPKKRLKNHLNAQVKRSGGGGEIKGAFIANVQTQHIGVRHAGVFIRKNGDASLPIKQLYGPSVPQMLGNQEISAFIEDRAKVVFDERLDHEIDVILRGVVN